MFERIEPAPPDPILGLTEAFREDPNPKKINLSVGVYQDATGKTPILESVQQGRPARARAAEVDVVPADPGLARLCHGRAAADVRRRARSGDVRPGRHVAHAGRHRRAARRRRFHPSAVAQGDRLADAADLAQPSADLRRRRRADEELSRTSTPRRTAWHSTKRIAAIEKMPAGDVILLHGCCHNPTGIDPTPEQWKKLADVDLRPRPVAAAGLRLPRLRRRHRRRRRRACRRSARPGAELIVCSSFSKNFGLYCERVGALTIVAKDKAAADTVQSQVKACIRANYSNPPAHGAELVTTVLGDAELRKQWEQEVAQMRDRINGMRELLVKTLKAKGVPGDYSFITRQRGMFSFSGLTPRAGRGPEAEVRDLHRRLRPHQRRRHHGAKRRPAVRGDCGGGKIEAGSSFCITRTFKVAGRRWRRSYFARMPLIFRTTNFACSTFSLMPRSHYVAYVAVVLKKRGTSQATIWMTPRWTQLYAACAIGASLQRRNCLMRRLCS